MKIFGSISEIVSAVFRKNNQTITVRPNQPTTYTAARDVQLPPEDADSVLVSETATQTLTNKTLTSPAISTPTGLNKSDVGLSNVDNTSDATKNSASATLTNKTISGASNTITNVSLSTGVTGTLPTANGGTGQSSTATFPTAGTVAVVPASGVVKSSGTALTSGNVSLSTEVTGTLPTANGGTGQNSTATFPLSGTVATTADITTANLTGTLTIAKGGTNSSTALNNSRVMISSAGAIVEASAITASRALVSDAGGLPTASSVTSTELGYVSGVTSAIQTQIGNKADTSALTAHTGASSNVHGITGAVVGTVDNQVLTNKDIDGGTASNARRITLPGATKSVLDGLTRKAGTLLYATDTQKPYIDNGTNLSEIGSGSGSGRNYLSTWADGSNPIGTIQNGLTATGNRLAPTNWGASDTTKLTVANNSTTPVRQSGDYKLTHVAVGAAFIETPQFSLDIVDLSKSVVVSFDMTGNVLSGDYDVVAVRYNSAGTFQEVISIAGTASSGTPASALLPTGTTTFRGFFITSNTQTDLYSIRIRRLSGTATSSPQIDTLFVGPQSLATGAIVTDWQSYTPTFTGFGTTTSVQFAWRRVGTDLEIIGSWVTGTTTATEARVSLPNNLTSAGSPALSSIQQIGTVVRNVINGPYYWSLLVEPGVQYVTFGINNNTNSPLTKQNASAAFLSGELMKLYGKFPVAEWSAANVTTAERAVEEYASNSSATDADDTGTSNFVFGVSGSAGVLGATNLTDMRKKRIRFTTPILPTDKIEIEISPDGIYWYPMIGYRDNSSSIYATPTLGIYNGTGTTSSSGISYERISGSNTDIYVVFGRYQTNMPAYTNAWGGFTGHRFRVRKVSGGAAVGFPIAPANITLINSADNYAGNTRLGLMQYQHGTTYNGGIAPTVALVGGVGSLTAVNLSSFIPYQLQDGTWKLKFNLYITLSSATRSTVDISINGVSFNATLQAITANNAGSSTTLYAITNTGGILTIAHGSASTAAYIYQGDVLLASKPTWAY